MPNPHIERYVKRIDEFKDHFVVVCGFAVSQGEVPDRRSAMEVILEVNIPSDLFGPVPLTLDQLHDEAFRRFGEIKHLLDTAPPKRPDATPGQSSSQPESSGQGI